MAKRYVTLKCPFCRKGDIEIIYFPSTVKFRKGSYGGSKQAFVRAEESLLVTTEKCPKCGKDNKEIERALKRNETKPRSHEELLRRIKESGLPTKIESKHS